MKRGPKPERGETATDRIVVRVTPPERADLDAVARENHSTRAAVIRDAVNEYVADYRDRRVFSPQK